MSRWTVDDRLDALDEMTTDFFKIALWIGALFLVMVAIGGAIQFLDWATGQTYEECLYEYSNTGDPESYCKR